MVFSQSWFLAFLFLRSNETKTLFWHSIKQMSSLQWKLHQLESRKGNYSASRQSGIFKKGVYCKVYFIATFNLLLPMWIGASLKAGTMSRTFVNSHTIPCINNFSAKLIIELFDLLINSVGLNLLANFLGFFFLL